MMLFMSYEACVVMTTWLDGHVDPTLGQYPKYRVVFGQEWSPGNFETIEHLIHIFAICRRDALCTTFRASTVRSAHTYREQY